jgi:gluconolactonase
MTTNVCFGGEGLTKAYVTLSGLGQLVELDWTDRDWTVAGLPLAFAR